jgi:NADH:ubiquinone oxidoreductase subunit F (NADH-binding)/NADH:ubiquinone oxidoreductase subunit E/Pyruvate/2-oxoacid:ferredoxin oxidoreductase delta subunit
MEKNQIIIQTDKIIEEIGTEENKVIPILHAIQKQFRYLPKHALKRVCEISDISSAQITGVSTFYTQFRHIPMGEHLIHVCTGTACHIKGAPLVYDAFCRELKIEQDRDTDPEGKFTIQKVSCLGCCTIAPVVQIDDHTFGRVTQKKVPNVLADFLNTLSRLDETRGIGKIESPAPGEVKLGLGSCCIASGSNKVNHALEHSLAQLGFNSNVKPVGCVGMCHRTPLMEVSLPDKGSVFYDKVQAEDVKRILYRHYKPKSLIKKLTYHTLNLVEQLLVYDDPLQGEKRPLNTKDKAVDSFLKKQVHISTEHSGQLNPLDFDEYCSKGGFEALRKTLTSLTSQEVINKVKDSGHRGRGGAGYPTGEKMDIVAQGENPVKYIICNGDEGDPGAFMDRMILESYPFRVIEGLIILAYAVGSNQGYFYIRAEYPLAVDRITQAIEMTRKNNFLGKNILGSGFSFSLKIIQGAGAFVCGEETALITSIEGKRGNPRYRPPYPARQGLWGKPTLVNNCETIATIPWIIRNGPEAFSQLGTTKSKGTKVFSLAGKIKRGGLIEVPMGISIREIVEEIGGGIENDRTFKAIQVGGPSGGCIPAELSDIKVDFEELTEAGAMMGSGGLLVMDDRDCMVEIARYFLAFTCSQSCGKCTFCRIGTKMMLEILENLCKGKGKRDDLIKLEEIAQKTKRGSLCGLGKTAPNPVLTTLKYFRHEYQAHLEGKCPAGYCKDLITYSINSECIGCTLCAQRCPADAIEINPYEKHEIDSERCVRCGTCQEVCPSEAVDVK